jgi:hypothetical protein
MASTLTPTSTAVSAAAVAADTTAVLAAAVTTAVAVTTADVTTVAVTTTAPAAACTSLYWPTIPIDLHDVPLILDKENGTFITCLACQQYPQRKGVVDGKIPCARKRYFKYQSMLEHVKTEYHALANEKLLYNKDGENLNEAEFVKKHNHKYVACQIG